jgi:uroporphyrinogen III methyltransferase/synthase
VGKHGQTRIWTQTEINQRIVAEAQSGKHVVRLKGGDPVVFGRLAEECEVVHTAGIEFEIVPGITAALAAGGFAGIPITHRGVASAVALVTGHEEEEKTETNLDWSSLARFPGTIVIYMGVTTVSQWSRSLLSAGMDPATPAAIVRRCSWPDQEVWQTTLAELETQLIPATKIRPPVIVILGRVVELRATLDWLSQLPLAGQTILVTRSEQQGEELGGPLRERGARVIYQPAITIDPPPDLQPLDEVLERLEEFSWIVFSSANGVRFFLDRLFERGDDVRRLGASQIACVGTATGEALRDYRLKADLVPQDFRGRALAELLAPLISGQPTLLVRASRGSELISQNLRAAGGVLTEVIAYEHRDVLQPKEEVLEAIAQGRVDWVTVTSSAIARSLVQLFGSERMRGLKLASLSSQITSVLGEYGLTPSVEADNATMESLVSAITLSLKR